MNVEDKVKQIMLDVLDLSEPDLTPDAELRSVLGATSVDVVEILADLENEFDMDLPDEEVRDIRTYGELVAFMKSKVG
jgi:acyl carrier protein